MARSRAVLAASIFFGCLFFERLKGRREMEIVGKEVECPNIIWDMGLRGGYCSSGGDRATVASVTTR